MLEKALCAGPILFLNEAYSETGKLCSDAQAETRHLSAGARRMEVKNHLQLARGSHVMVLLCLATKLENN